MQYTLVTQSSQFLLHNHIRWQIPGCMLFVDDIVLIGDVVISRIERFRYLDSIIQENGEVDEDINQRIKIGWQK